MEKYGKTGTHKQGKITKIITRAPDVRLTCCLARCETLFQTQLSKASMRFSCVKRHALRDKTKHTYNQFLGMIVAPIQIKNLKF